MALTIETGAGLPNAESYASVAAADAYHAKRLNAAWAALDTTTKEALLIKATEYMVGQYRDSWKGQRTSATQALDWPRYNVQLPDVGFGAVPAYVPWNVVPAEVVNACAVLALQANSGDLAPPLKRTVKEKQIGPIKTIYADGAPEHVRYRAVDQLLAPYLVGSGTLGKMVRG